MVEQSINMMNGFAGAGIELMDDFDRQHQDEMDYLRIKDRLDAVSTGKKKKVVL
jgi:hypothetical protein